MPLLAAYARQLQPKRYVFLHVAPGKQTFVLKDHPALSARSLHFFPFQLNGAMLIWHKPGNQIQQRGFPAPGRAKHNQQLTALQRQVDVLQGRFATVISRQICNSQHRSPLISQSDRSRTGCSPPPPPALCPALSGTWRYRQSLCLPARSAVVPAGQA